MTARTHILGGAVSGLAFALFRHDTQILSIAAAVSITSVGALFPDIDNHRSKMGARVKITSRVIQSTFGHRTLFHSPILYLILHCLAVLFFPAALQPYVPWFTLGVCSHLVLDALNKKGIPLFYPYRKHFRLANIRSGGVLEQFLALLLALLMLTELWLFWKRLF